MSDIQDASGHKMATIGEDGKVRNSMNVVIGYVTDDHHVHSATGQEVGSFDASGLVYKAGSHIGTVKDDGRVYDYENRCIGRVAGDHIESGGAALLLLVI